MGREEAEREAARAKGQEYAVPCDLGVSWETGAPMPHLLCAGHRAFLVFLLREPDPARASGAAEPLALVEFRGATVKLGSPNDEVLHGHPLYGKGLVAYGAHYVMNSRWLRELEEINKVHSRYDPAHWKELKHYLFAFHDETFECLARGHEVQIHRTSMKDLVALAAQRMVSAPTGWAPTATSASLSTSPCSPRRCVN
jgi:hypothetical protein